ncbi:MAG: hypothetical protein JKX98_11400 [Alcanivoracaceae bacterium]|nr:hypothetical protein [Alcanivoracaceae bacterium]
MQESVKAESSKIFADVKEVDITIAIEWYEKQRRGLGFEFLDCVEVSIKSILVNPKS